MASSRGQVDLESAREFMRENHRDWIYAEGKAETLSLPEAMEPLIDY
jgi:hypothetical protein